MKVLIAGGGIGGLTAALCCYHFGHDVTVFEQAPELGDVGAGLQLSPNAIKVFEALGIAELIGEHAFRPRAIEARMGISGSEIFTIPLADHAAEEWGSPYLHIHRRDLIAALNAAISGKSSINIELGAAVLKYLQIGKRVTAILSDEREIGGDILIGADGIHSAIREHMLGPSAPEFTGNTAWRAVVPIKAMGNDAPPPTACVWMGKGRHAVTYRLRGGELANFVGVVERNDWQGESWTARGSREDALADFAGWHPTITRLIESADPDSLFRWALFDRPPLDQWTDGRTALLGDAAHPMLPFLAQGAAMAIEDAWVIAREISRSDRPVERSIKAYQDIRLARTTKAQHGSRANMKTFHKRNFVGQLLTYGPMWIAGKAFPQIVHRRMDWLYDYDVTQN